MIKFQILSSPDLNILAPFEYYKNQIYFGQKADDLRINDSEILTTHLMLEVVASDLIVHPQKGVSFFLINGKRASTIRKIKIGDEITLGKTIIKILSFEETPKISKKVILDQKLKSLINENSPRLSVIESLTKRMQ